MPTTKPVKRRLKRSDVKALATQLLAQQGRVEQGRAEQASAEQEYAQQRAWREEERLKKEKEDRAETRRLNALLALSPFELKTELERRYKLALIERLDGIPKHIDALVQGIAQDLICNALGLEDAWSDGRWSPKSEKENPLLRSLGVRLVQQIELALPDFLNDFARVSDRQMSAVRSGFRAAFKEALRTKLDNKLETAVLAAAERQAGLMVQKAADVLPPEVHAATRAMIEESEDDPV